MSITLSSGLVGVSSQISFVFAWVAATISSADEVARQSKAIPYLAKTRWNRRYVPP